MEIEVVGPGCANCRRLYQEVQRALAQSGQPATVAKVEAMEAIAARGLLRTPGLVIDGRVVAYGRVPPVAEIVTMITTALANP